MKNVVRLIWLLVFVVALIHIIHALTLDRTIEYKEVRFYSSRWPQVLDGYQIAFVTDTHVMSDEALLDVVEQINAWQADLLLLGGDFTFRGSHYRRTMAILSQTETTDGIFGVEGNHDDFRHLFAAMEAYGIVPLSNNGIHIHEGFYLAGVEDLWNRNPCVAKSIADATEDDFVLLISHNPDVSMQQDTTGVDLILSGHTHGGQITFFGIWAPYFTFTGFTGYGQRFVCGWAVSRDGVPVYISRGVGQYLPRVFARPQVILVTMATGPKMF
ncbi:MAG: metallophosphoesterase [Clostridiales bacterium]|nr:metallophosphoesterase [Clostridiales bacterium]